MVRLAAAICLLVLLLAPARAEQIMGAPETRVWLGVGIAAGEVGVLVTEVVDETPARTAGLLAGDEILSVDGRRVALPGELQRLILRKRVGSEVLLRVLRDGRAFRVRVELEAMPDANEVLRRRLVDKLAPSFDVKVLNGTAKGKLSDLRGKVVVVEFWATYCAACQATHAALSKAAAERAGKGLAVLAISGESESVLKHYLSKHVPAFSVARDTDGAASLAYYAVRLPTLVVIDRRGTVRFAGVSDDPRRTGLSAREAIEANVAAAVFAAERLLRDSCGMPGRSKVKR